MANTNRPLSPHLQVYDMLQITALLSILHRITGVFLGLGMLLVIWWLVALASGPEYYNYVLGVAGSWIGRLVLFGFTAALFYHLCNGIRHLFWDAGRGFEIPAVYRSGWTVVIASLVLTVLAWVAAYAWGG